MLYTHDYDEQTVQTAQSYKISANYVSDLRLKSMREKKKEAFILFP